MLFMFLVSFPALVILTVTDQQVLVSALETVEHDGTLVMSNEEGSALCERWRVRFSDLNLVAQLVGVLVGITVAYANYVLYTPSSIGFWMADDDRLLPVGYVFLCCLFLFYALVPVYVLRGIGISLLLRDIVGHSDLRMLPLHPDRSGGLRPVGRLGLRNQYLLTILGVNAVLLVWMSLLKLDAPSLRGMVTTALVAYAVLGPVVFMAPLLPFRAAMLKAKSELLADVAQRLRAELDRLRGELRSGTISKHDEELVDRLRKIGAVIDELPIWPFDAGTTRKFLAAYVIPVLSSVVYPLLKLAYEWVGL